MQTFHLHVSLNRPYLLLAELCVKARTKADAILNAQKEAARRWGLNRSEEALVRVEFQNDKE